MGGIEARHDRNMAIGQRLRLVENRDRPMIPPREEALDGETVRDENDVVRAIFTFKTPEQRIHENRHAVVDIRAGFPFGKAVEEHPKLLAGAMTGIVDVPRGRVAVFLLAQRGGLVVEDGGTGHSFQHRLLRLERAQIRR